MRYRARVKLPKKAVKWFKENPDATSSFCISEGDYAHFISKKAVEKQGDFIQLQKDSNWGLVDKDGYRYRKKWLRDITPIEDEVQTAPPLEYDPKDVAFKDEPTSKICQLEERIDNLNRRVGDFENTRGKLSKSEYKTLSDRINKLSERLDDFQKRHKEFLKRSIESQETLYNLLFGQFEEG